MTADTRPWLIAADWQSRALLLAELDVRGIEVRAVPGMRWAMRALLRERPAVPLVLIDTAGDSEAQPPTVERLLAILAEDGAAPRLILLVSAFERTSWEEAFGGKALLIVRPRTVGEVADLVQAELARASGSPGPWEE